jgi:hypothetical protein
MKTNKREAVFEVELLALLLIDECYSRDDDYDLFHAEIEPYDEADLLTLVS